MRIAVVIPAYNESASISKVIAEIQLLNSNAAHQYTPVVVNDCSTDETGSIIEKLTCVALNLPVNLGIGGAVQTGFKYAFENNFDYAVQVDGDGQHPAEDIPRLLEYALQNNLDVTIGSRFITGDGFQSSAFRRAGIKWFTILNRMLTGVTVYDSTSGFRLLNKKALEVVAEYYPDEYPEPEAIILYAAKHLSIGEVQVKMRERQGGTSSINSFKAIYYMWKVTLGVIFSKIRN
ncbi:MAG: glycosyltransferase family 2 protein [Bacteroidia bacterium]